MDIGLKVKNLRQMMGLTQAELAERSDLTKGFISQVEHNATSPSLDNLENIVNALGTNLYDFFKKEKEQKILYKKDESLIKEYEDLNIRINWIVSDTQKNMMEPLIFEFLPQGRTKNYKPFEGEGFGYVLEGKLKLVFGTDEYKLSKGDSFYFEATKHYEVINEGKTKAKLLWVLTPPNF